VSTTAVAFLGAIAVSVVVMALIQIGAIVFAARAARRVNALLGRLERDLEPAIERVTAMTGEAARAASLAAAQVERVDRVAAELGTRVEASATAVQRAIGRPAREGAAIVAGVRAGLVTLRDLRQRRRAGADGGSVGGADEDPWFIG
jgi:alkylated DNA nucleotide flippase Atl1